MIEKIVKAFLKPYGSKKMCLGFSGGADSMALFLALYKIGHPFVAAHIDHGWRDESFQEAQSLKVFSEKMGVPFYLKRLSKEDFQGNLESAARLKRLEFFKEVVSLEGAEGVLLAHHADDLAETTLKKVFEGVMLPNLSSMTAVANFEELFLFRPLLGVSKEDILAYVGSSSYIQDETNFSDRFLRGRLRADLIPYLSKTFGKNVTSAFVTLSEESKELKAYLDSELEGFTPEKSQFGVRYDFQGPIHPYLLKKGVEKALRNEGIPIRKQDINALQEAILAKKCRFLKKIGAYDVMADKGVLSLIPICYTKGI